MLTLALMAKTNALRKTIRKLGSVTALGHACGVTSQAVSQWEVAPSQHVIVIAAATGFEVTPHELRPDLYPHPEDGLPRELRGRTARA